MTSDLLNAAPLPLDFSWPRCDGIERPVLPGRPGVCRCYGKWLSDNAAFRGVFDLVHDILADADVAVAVDWSAAGPPGNDHVVDQDWGRFLAVELQALRGIYEPLWEGSSDGLADFIRCRRARPRRRTVRWGPSL